MYAPRNESVPALNSHACLFSFVTQLTNWYVRLNRDRLKGMEGGEDGTSVEEEAATGL